MFIFEEDLEDMPKGTTSRAKGSQAEKEELSHIYTALGLTPTGKLKKTTRERRVRRWKVIINEKPVIIPVTWHERGRD